MSPHSPLIPACAGLILALAGCSGDTLHRIAYGAVQGAGQQRCLDNSPSSQSMGCFNSLSYDEYQQRRHELATSR